MYSPPRTFPLVDIFIELQFPALCFSLFLVHVSLHPSRWGITIGLLEHGGRWEECGELHRLVGWEGDWETMAIDQ